MLNTDVEEITFGDDGKTTGIKCGADIATAPIVICDPSYVKDEHLKPMVKVIKAICILDHPIPETNDATSTQIIIPAKQTGR